MAVAAAAAAVSCVVGRGLLVVSLLGLLGRGPQRSRSALPSGPAAIAETCGPPVSERPAPRL